MKTKISTDNSPPLPRLFTISEAARRVGISRWTIHRMIQKGELGYQIVHKSKLIPVENLQNLGMSFPAKSKRKSTQNQGKAA